MSEGSTNERHRLIAASIGVAILRDRRKRTDIFLNIDSYGQTENRPLIMPKILPLALARHHHGPAI